MCFDRVIIVYTHVLIYNQIEIKGENIILALIGTVNTVRMPG